MTRNRTALVLAAALASTGPAAASDGLLDPQLFKEHRFQDGTIPAMAFTMPPHPRSVFAGAYDRPVWFGHESIEYVELPAGIEEIERTLMDEGEAKTVRIRTCRDLHETLAAPRTTADMIRVATIGRTCAIVTFFVALQPAQQSHFTLAELLDPANHSIGMFVPPVIFGDAYRRLQAEAAAGVRADSGIENLQIAEDGLSVTFDREGARFFLGAVGVGDFDGDGVADVLVLQTSRFPQGSAFTYEYRVMTRHSPGAAFETIDWKPVLSWYLHLH